ncbi:uncharacterized protein LOC131223691 isoform X3 [Magnolia sinica]|uniref:uncharacterized protein LOC131223691 isoform X3 n=1 Tax=Magnolia sinica TaxID=86752 RepID=UPI002658146B|nr:uncharacterized protein LOC131223691 isoform X3 [Magnolia sinica]
MIRLLFLVALIHRVSVYAVSGSCELSVFHGSSLYNFSLTRPSPKYPHGVLSEDGFYKVSVNETLLWFQLCDRMIFNHDPPGCFDCQDCGGPLHCGMKCSALVANNIGDKNDPQKGVTVKMSTSVLESNCSLSVSVFCDSKGILGPYSLNRSGDCNYATELRHPSGCATIISIRGRGWRWFGTLITILLCLLGGYLLVGTVYRYFFLGVRGIEVVPNLEFWLSLPRKAQSLVMSLVRRFRRQPQGNRSTYTQATF